MAHRIAELKRRCKEAPFRSCTSTTTWDAGSDFRAVVEHCLTMA